MENELPRPSLLEAGWRIIKMNLERQAIIMNHKKIRRLMKKYGLITQVRRKEPI